MATLKRGNASSSTARRRGRTPGHAVGCVARRACDRERASTAKIESVKSLGAHEVIDHTRARFDEELSPVDVVFDTIGGELLRRSPAIVRSGGRLVSIAEEPPEVPSESNAGAIYFVVKPQRDQLVEVDRLAANGELKPAIDSTFPLSEARSAFERSMERGTRGKVVLQVIND